MTVYRTKAARLLLLSVASENAGNRSDYRPINPKKEAFLSQRAPAVAWRT